MMRRVLLDSNALDPLTVHVGAFEVLDEAVSAAKLEILYTHVTVDEIAAVPDLERRQWLLNMLVFLGRPVYTPHFSEHPSDGESRHCFGGPSG
jgi:hypothetical protein